MILVADGGSTKVDWCLADQGKAVKRIRTKGANPFFRTREDIGEEIRQTLVPEIKGCRIDSVHFFGAGCASPEKNETIRAAIAGSIAAPRIEVGSDLLGAARALCGNRPGIACILGTGSNSCFYDGKRITENVPPLGFILGDEGSGAALGKLFIGACLKSQLTPGIKEAFLQHTGLTTAGILDRVYKQPLPNRFLASVVPFIHARLADPAVCQLVYDAFRDFLQKNVMQYDYRAYEVHFTGSVAFHFQKVLRRAAEASGIRTGIIEQSPMEGLLQFFTERQVAGIPQPGHDVRM